MAQSGSEVNKVKLRHSVSHGQSFGQTLIQADSNHC